MSVKPLRKRPERAPHFSSFLYRNEGSHKFYNNIGFLPFQNQGDGCMAVDNATGFGSRGPDRTGEAV